MSRTYDFEFDSAMLAPCGTEYRQLRVEFSHSDVDYSDIELIEDCASGKSYEPEELPQADRDRIEDYVAEHRREWVADGNAPHESPCERGFRRGED